MILGDSRLQKGTKDNNSKNDNEENNENENSTLLTPSFCIIEMVKECLKLSQVSHPCHGAGMMLLSKLLKINQNETNEQDLELILDIVMIGSKQTKRSLKNREFLRARRLEVVGEMFDTTPPTVRNKFEGPLIQLIFPALQDISDKVRTKASEVLKKLFVHFPSEKHIQMR